MGWGCCCWGCMVIIELASVVVNSHGDYALKNRQRSTQSQAPGSGRWVREAREPIGRQEVDVRPVEYFAGGAFADEGGEGDAAVHGGQIEVGRRWGKAQDG